MINDVNKQILDDKRDRRIRAFLIVGIMGMVAALAIELIRQSVAQ